MILMEKIKRTYKYLHTMAVQTTACNARPSELSPEQWTLLYQHLV